MPFVKIDLFEGRSEQQKIDLARDVADIVSKHTKAPKEDIHVFINDMVEGSYFPHGEIKRKG
ncbi:4-oxalocrotonate tautomerase [Streptococcus sp. CSL10205-OR2]|uniref:4-oxalocrotonate tautomerase n=1 Tax=Streptococcus sp. CSL10205-OR2 TaxID=2980558 RepID=UPI0021DA8D4A|nr:4-oxalocrotonate tautomerase [Streptococcus sp. CSL10205-OR2]MCU9533217.1 4-oxalocrotonate tautomerase [Streptococcus sp. CSL10205-OR2]